MSKKFVALAMVTAGIILAMGCSDRAKPAYGRCLQAEIKGDLIAAGDACQAAIAADPLSEAGKAATAKLTAIQPAIEAAKKAKAEAEAKAAEEKRIVDAEAAEERRKADEAAKQAAEQARIARQLQLRSKVKRKYLSTEPDGDCTGNGLPPYYWRYEGGTFDEDTEVAMNDGCQKLYPTLAQNTAFCCPDSPLE